MSIVSIIILAVIVVVIAYLILLYNHLVSVKHAVSKAWANIDVLLKQRHDELPKLVKTCEGYMQHERAMLEKLSEARPRVQPLAKRRTCGRGRGREPARARLGKSSRWPRPTRTSRPTSRSCSCRPHQRAREPHRRPPRVLQRLGQHQQRAHRAVSRQLHRRHVQLQAGAAAGIPRQRRPTSTSRNCSNNAPRRVSCACVAGFAFTPATG